MLTPVIYKLEPQISVGKYDEPYRTTHSTKGGKLYQTLIKFDTIPSLDRMVTFYYNKLDYVISLKLRKLE